MGQTILLDTPWLQLNAQRILQDLTLIAEAVTPTGSFPEGDLRLRLPRTVLSHLRNIQFDAHQSLLQGMQRALGTRVHIEAHPESHADLVDAEEEPPKVHLDIQGL